MGPDEEKLVRQSKSCTCMAHAIYAIVKKTMVHKCSVGYCKDSEAARCSKYFPKRLTQVTYSDHKGFFHYRRIRPEDQYVVAHNHQIVLLFKNHCNFEMASASHSVEYVHSYQNKGFDYTCVSVRDVLNSGDLTREFRDFQKLCHVGFMEAYLRFISMNLQLHEPCCDTLYVHLPGKGMCH